MITSTGTPSALQRPDGLGNNVGAAGRVAHDHAALVQSGKTGQNGHRALGRQLAWREGVGAGLTGARPRQIASGLGNIGVFQSGAAAARQQIPLLRTTSSWLSRQKTDG